jgi:hypothetical protein
MSVANPKNPRLVEVGPSVFSAMQMIECGNHLIFASYKKAYGTRDYEASR